MRSLAAALLAGLLLAGCTTTDDTRAPPEVVRAVANTRAMDWDRGDFWAFEARYRDRTFDVSLVVHEARADGFRLGSNLSAGFFGLPFTGNVTRDLNPMVSGVEWPMFRFPLEDGKSWSYEMFGHEATATAYAAIVHAPGVGPHPGFRLEAASFGQVFARYDYSPATGWLTRLELIEPTDRTQVLEARLTGFGENFGRPYYVEAPIATLRVEYPSATAPGPIEVRVPAGFSRVQATLSASSAAGVVDAKLLDGRGRELARAQALGQGLDAQRVSVRAGEAATWTLEQAGVGKGAVHLEVTGLVAVQPWPTPYPPPRDAAAAADGPQSTRPALPQTGHTTSTGPPVGA